MIELNFAVCFVSTSYLPMARKADLKLNILGKLTDYSDVQGLCAFIMYFTFPNDAVRLVCQLPSIWRELTPSKLKLNLHCLTNNFHSTRKQQKRNEKLPQKVILVSISTV